MVAGVLDEAQRKDQLLLIYRLFQLSLVPLWSTKLEDDQVAALMNTHYTSIKIDRRNMPDLDARYVGRATNDRSGRLAFEYHCLA